MDRKNMVIALDAFGGDKAPDEALKGAAAAAKAYGVHVILTGEVNKVKKRLSELNLPLYNLDFSDAAGVIHIEDDPLSIRKEKRNSSMGKAFSLLTEGSADAMVSAGSTAALVVGGTTLVGRIKGVRRPALATIMPNVAGKLYLLLDSGANSECRPEMLVQFAVMGNIYARQVLGIRNPRVALLNIGAEREKGRELERGTFAALEALKEKDSRFNFIGNAEGRDPTLGSCDVVVTDGFTGNIYLKTIEGMGKFMKVSLNNIFKKNIASNIGYLLSKNGVAALTKSMDYREVGGSPLLGTAKPVIKAHGSSDALAFKNAIRQAAEFAAGDVAALVGDSLAQIPGNNQ